MDISDSKKQLCLLIEDQQHAAAFLLDVVKTAFPNLQVVALRNVREAEEWLKERQRLDVKIPMPFSLIDLGLPDGTGIDIIKLLSVHEPETRTIVVTIYDDDAYLFEALAAGASGYLLKEEERNFLIEMLKRIQRGEPLLSPSVARRLLDHFRAPSAPLVTESNLTPRERETLTLLAKGLTVIEAARSMGLSAQTVAGYVKIIYQKLHVSNRAEATREAIRRGLV